jgi:hypothetical protein
MAADAGTPATNGAALICKSVTEPPTTDDEILGRIRRRALAHDGTDAPDVQALAAKDPAMLVWWATDVECASAVARLASEDALTNQRLRTPSTD